MQKVITNSEIIRIYGLLCKTCKTTPNDKHTRTYQENIKNTQANKDTTMSAEYMPQNMT